VRILRIWQTWSIERKLVENLLQQPQCEQKLVLVVGLEDCQTNPEQLYQNVHLVVLRRLEFLGKKVAQKLGRAYTK
jgi:hypothetical protein